MRNSSLTCSIRSPTSAGAERSPASSISGLLLQRTRAGGIDWLPSLWLRIWPSPTPCRSCASGCVCGHSPASRGWSGLARVWCHASSLAAPSRRSAQRPSPGARLRSPPASPRQETPPDCVGRTRRRRDQFTDAPAMQGLRHTGQAFRGLPEQATLERVLPIPRCRVERVGGRRHLAREPLLRVLGAGSGLFPRPRGTIGHTFADLVDDRRRCFFRGLLQVVRGGTRLHRARGFG